MRGVKVAVRVRPLSQKEKDAGMRKCCSVLPGTNVVVIKREQRDPYLKSQGQGVSEYEFDSVFDDDATQQEVYEKTTKPYLKNLIAGLNVTVFAYGATGAGKTHTMMGSSRRDDATDHAEAGIIPNSLTDLFNQLQEKKHTAAPGERYEVSCSFMEVYNEQVYDLVEPTGKVLQICEDAVTKVMCTCSK
jgi:kinesin family protein 18/19